MARRVRLTWSTSAWVTSLLASGRHRDEILVSYTSSDTDWDSRSFGGWLRHSGIELFLALGKLTPSVGFAL